MRRRKKPAAARSLSSTRDTKQLDANNNQICSIEAFEEGCVEDIIVAVCPGMPANGTRIGNHNSTGILRPDSFEIRARTTACRCCFSSATTLPALLITFRHPRLKESSYPHSSDQRVPAPKCSEAVIREALELAGTSPHRRGPFAIMCSVTSVPAPSSGSMSVRDTWKPRL